jgi:hypothetical protein
MLGNRSVLNLGFFFFSGFGVFACTQQKPSWSQSQHQGGRGPLSPFLQWKAARGRDSVQPRASLSVWSSLVGGRAVWQWEDRTPGAHSVGCSHMPTPCPPPCSPRWAVTQSLPVPHSGSVLLSPTPLHTMWVFSLRAPTQKWAFCSASIGFSLSTLLLKLYQLPEKNIFYYNFGLWYFIKNNAL